MDAEQKQIIANAMAEELSSYANKNAPSESGAWRIEFDGELDPHDQKVEWDPVYRLSMHIVYTDDGCEENGWIQLRSPRIPRP